MIAMVVAIIVAGLIMGAIEVTERVRDQRAAREERRWLDHLRSMSCANCQSGVGPLDSCGWCPSCVDALEAMVA